MLEHLCYLGSFFSHFIIKFVLYIFILFFFNGYHLFYFFFFFNDPPPPEFSPLPLPAALPTPGRAGDPASETLAARLRDLKLPVGRLKTGTPPRLDARSIDFLGMQEQPGDSPEPGCRSEEHTSELQSQSNLVCRLLLEKKNKNN